MDTKTCIYKIKIEMDFIKKRLEEIPTREEMELSNAKLINKVLKECDKRYASKLVERIVFALCGLILGGVVVALVALIVR